jgi:hypothetical protein
MLPDANVQVVPGCKVLAIAQTRIELPVMLIECVPAEIIMPVHI